MFPKDAAGSAQGREMVAINNGSMKEPSTATEVLELHRTLRTDPQRYLRVVNGWIEANPSNAHAFWQRHLGWIKIRQPYRALDDLDRAIELDPEPVAFRSRAKVHRQLGDYEKALADFSRGEALDPKQWEDDAFGIYYQADTHARLGNERAALAYCARLPEYFWTPGIHGAPAGSKTEIADELRRRAADAKKNRDPRR